jgi:alkanesulfonate monooxygenase
MALAKRENLSIRELVLRFAAVQGHRIVVGTPVDIADQLEDWFVHEGADGFNLKPSFIPDSLDDFVNLVVPQLQKRGIFRTEYEGKTLREHLGLKRPPNPFSATAGLSENGVFAAPPASPAAGQPNVLPLRT